MERYSIPLLLGLLAGVAALAGAATPRRAEVSVSALAAEVAASCAAGVATPPCCGAVVAFVKVAGGSASLRRVASDVPAGLDAAALLASCRGLLRPAGSDFPALRSSITVVPSSTSAAGAPARHPVLAVETKDDAAVQPSSTSYGGPLPSLPPTFHLSGDDRKVLLVMVVAQVVGLAMTFLLFTYEVYRCFHPKK